MTKVVFHSMARRAIDDNDITIVPAAAAGGGRECQNTPYIDAELDAVLAYRWRLIAILAEYRPRPDAAPPITIPNPLELWQTLFLARLDPYIMRTVVTLLRRLPRTITSRPAYMYVFRDARDPPDVYKIGSTTRTPRQRIAEWRRQLAPSSSDEVGAVRLLFSQPFPGPTIRIIETIVHTLFFCEWLPRRIDIRSGRRLMEYFRIEDLAALRLMIRGLAMYVAQQTHA